MQRSIARLAMAATLLVALLAGGCATALLGGAASGDYAPQPRPRPAGQVDDDESIGAAVRAALAAEPSLREADVAVLTRGGVVSLQGAVASAADRSLAGRIARRTRGVRSVRNELRIQ